MFPLTHRDRVALASLGALALGLAFCLPSGSARAVALMHPPTAQLTQQPHLAPPAAPHIVRDPFDLPAPTLAAADAAPRLAAPAARRVAEPLPPAPPLPALPPLGSALPPNAGAFARTPLPLAPAASGSSAVALPRVSAVVTGPHPYALVNDGASARIVTVGDVVDGKNVVAISDRELILSGGIRIPVDPTASAPTSPEAH